MSDVVRRDPLAGKYAKKFPEEFAKAKERLAPLGGTVSAGTHDYEAFIYEGPGVRLVFYPHRTTARHYHIRVRAGGKCNPDALRAAIFALAENSCTFQFPANRELHNEAVRAAIRRDYEQRQRAATKGNQP